MPNNSLQPIEEFCNDLCNKEVSFVVSKWMIERTPYIFNNCVEEYIIWKENLASLIDVDSRAISIIGSACLGFSLNPNKNFKLYDDDSDIDIAVISHYYFDIAWHYLRCLGAEIYSFGLSKREIIKKHQSVYIYWGTIATDKILSVLPFGKKWTLAISRMTTYPPSEGKEIKIRLYNDFESLRSYHIHNLKNLRNDLLKGGNNE